mgnify:CR=1 FL=1
MNRYLCFIVIVSFTCRSTALKGIKDNEITSSGVIALLARSDVVLIFDKKIFLIAYIFLRVYF